jgi:hypothetical protein
MGNNDFSFQKFFVDLECWQYSSKEEAVIGHENALRFIDENKFVLEKAKKRFLKTE